MSTSAVEIAPPLGSETLEKQEISTEVPALPQATLPAGPVPSESPAPPALNRPSQRRTPWIETLSLTDYEHKAQRLHDEIMAFVAFMTPSAQETRARELVMSTIKEVIQARFKNCTVSAFGSVAYGLSLPGGDLDLVIDTPEVYNRGCLERALYQLAAMFFDSRLTTSYNIIAHAKVPIIKMEVTAALGSLDFDISVNATNGLKAVPIIKGYLDELPALRPLVLVAKTFLSDKGLQAAACGGLSSYAIICMVIGFLKLNPELYDEKLLNSPVESESLGTLLLGFFDFYADKFPYKTSYISPIQGQILPKKGKFRGNARPDALAVECLVDQGNNVGKSAHRIGEIRAAFRSAAQTIRAYKLSPDHGNVLGSILGVSERTLKFCDRIRTLVDSGALEASLKSVVIPPADRPLPRSPPRPPRRPYNDRHPNPQQTWRHIPYQQPYQHQQRPRYPSHAGNVPFADRGPRYYTGPRGSSTSAGTGHGNTHPQDTTARHDQPSSSAYHSPYQRRF